MPRRLFALLAALFAGQSSVAAPGFKVTTDRTVDASSLESIVKDVWRLSGAKTNDQKAIALYEYLHRTIFHHAYPEEKEPQSVGPLKVINAYGWALCGGQHTVLKALFETAGWECRYVGWPGHTTIEVKYDGRWHYFDVFLKCYFWSKDKKYVVGQAEIAADPSLVTDAVKEGRAAREHLCCGDAERDVVAGCKAREVVGDEKGWASVTWRDEGYSPKLTLPSGAKVRLDWKGEPDTIAVDLKAPQHSCGIKDFRADSALGPVVEHYGPRNWSSGKFFYVSDFSKAADLADVALVNCETRDGKVVALRPGASATFTLKSPYPFVKVTTRVFGEGEARMTFSADGGATWDANFSPERYKQKYDLRIRVEFAKPIGRFDFDADIEHNRSALPHLLPGKNQVTVDLDGLTVPPEGSQLEVRYEYQEATAPAKRQRFDGKGVTYGESKVVTKTFDRLPGTFEIEVGGNTPPKMISLTRSVKSK